MLDQSCFIFEILALFISYCTRSAIIGTKAKKSFGLHLFCNFSLSVGVLYFYFYLIFVHFKFVLKLQKSTLITWFAVTINTLFFYKKPFYKKLQSTIQKFRNYLITTSSDAMCICILIWPLYEIWTTKNKNNSHSKTGSVGKYEP